MSSDEQRRLDVATIEYINGKLTLDEFTAEVTDIYVDAAEAGFTKDNMEQIIDDAVLAALEYVTSIVSENEHQPSPATPIQADGNTPPDSTFIRNAEADALFQTAQQVAIHGDSAGSHAFLRDASSRLPSPAEIAKEGPKTNGERGDRGIGE